MLLPTMFEIRKARLQDKKEQAEAEVEVKSLDESAAFGGCGVRDLRMRVSTAGNAIRREVQNGGTTVGIAYHGANVDMALEHYLTQQGYTVEHGGQEGGIKGFLVTWPTA